MVPRDTEGEARKELHSTPFWRRAQDGDASTASARPRVTGLLAPRPIGAEDLCFVEALPGANQLLEWLGL